MYNGIVEGFILSKFKLLILYPSPYIVLIKAEPLTNKMKPFVNVVLMPTV